MNSRQVQVKILVISSNAFSKVYNNGKTYEAIFSAFEKKSLNQLFFNPIQLQYIDLDYCNSYYLVSEFDIIRKILSPGKDCGKIITAPINLKPSANRKKMSKSLLNNALFRDMIWSTNLWKTETLKKWLRDINPDIIFFVGGRAQFSHKIARYAATYLNIPMVVYFTDDYLIYPKYRKWVDKIQYLRMKQFYKKTIEASSMRFVIGDMMAREYSKYFNKPFYSIMNSVDIYPYEPLQPKDEIVISYFGGLHLNRWRMLARLSVALPHNARLQVYTNSEITDQIDRRFNESGVEMMGSVSGDELRQAMLASDILLHVESDDPYNKSLTRLSVSTKIPEYLVSGRLVLGYGPTEVASMRLLSDNGIGLVISGETGEEELKNNISAILQDSDKRILMGKKAYDYAVSEFNRAVIARDFKEKLYKLKYNYHV